MAGEAGSGFRSGDWLEVGGCVVEPARNRVLREGQPVRVEPRVMDLLLCLCTRAREVVSKDDLLRVVWQGSFVSEHVLSHAVWQLRTALGNPHLVEAIPKRGYRLVAGVRRCPAELGGAEGVDRPRRLAVLPLANLTGGVRTERFADALHEALTGALAREASLRVISRTSTLRFRHGALALPRIARALGAEAVIEGAVLIAGRRVCVSAQLIDARSDTHLWAGRYERALGDTLSVQRGVARIVAREVSLRLAQPSPGAAARGGESRRRTARP
jgi:TolB-like protein